MTKLQKINKNLVFGLMLVLCLGMSFTLIAQNVNFMLIIEGGGGGGGSPPSAPTLYQPTSPDYDGSITLQWSSVSSATSYKVYRSTSQYGYYGYPIVTTLSNTYTDTRDPGTWWYKIKARNSYGSSSYSNVRSVEVIIEGIRWYNFPSYPLNPDDWSSNYINWMEDWRITKTAQGIYPGNNLVVCMQPMSYMQNVYTYNLEYALNMHVTTFIGDDDGWPQPTMDDYYGDYFYPAPMAVREVKVTNRFLGGQPPENSLSYIDASSNTLLGVYTSTNLEMENWVWNGDFSAGPLGICWEKYGTSHGSIGFHYNYGRYGYGMRIINNDNGAIGVYNTNMDISEIYGSDNLYIKYWGKRSSSSSATDVGVKILVTYTDGTDDVVMPEELRMTYTDNWWHFYEYSFEAPKTIASIQTYAINHVQGTVYFDQIYITNEGWDLDKRGNWEEGNYEDTQDTWWNEMRRIHAFNDGLGVVGTAIEVAGFISNFIPYYGTAIGIFCGIAGFFVDAFKITSNPFGTWNHKNGHTANNGEWGWVLACDDTAAMHYDLKRSDLDLVRTRTLEIQIQVWWSYVGLSDYLNMNPGDDVSDYATVTFEVDCSNIQWSP